MGSMFFIPRKASLYSSFIADQSTAATITTSAVLLTTIQPVESTSANLLDTMVNPDPTTMTLTAASPMTSRGKSVALFVFGATFQSLMTYLCTEIT